MYKALVAENSPADRAACVAALRRAGFDCSPASDGVVAQHLLNGQTFDAAIIGLRMKRKHGHELIVNLLDKRSGLVIVATTDVYEPRLMMDLLLRGASDVILKPIQYEMFAAKVKALVERDRQRAVGEIGDVPIDERIGNTAALLKRQLDEVTTNFQSTIQELETKREALEKGYVGSIRVLTNLFEQVSGMRQSHASRVEEIALYIARECDLDAEAIRKIRIAALLHEIGQFGMPDDIRTTPPWRLPAEARSQYQRYPVIGATILSEIGGAEPIAVLVENHAENYDGTGFPAGKRGEDIPLGSRIIRLADGYDTFLMFASGDETVERLKEHLSDQRGSAYDPTLYKHAMEYLHETAKREAEEIESIPATQLRSGHVLAENIYDNEGRFLVRKGLPLPETMLPRLSVLLGNDIVKVYVDTESKN